MNSIPNIDDDLSEADKEKEVKTETKTETKTEEKDEKKITSISLSPRKKRIIITASNSGFYSSCVTQIASMYRTSRDSWDEYWVLNLGLTGEEMVTLSNYDRVKVISLPGEVITVEDFNWKISVFKRAVGDNLFLYLDSGAMAIKDVGEIFDIIENEDVFCVGDFSQVNFKWSHPTSVAIMRATHDELGANQLWAGIFGWKAKGKYQQLIDDAYKFSKIKECIHGEKYTDYGMYHGYKIEGHRHDQTILSILAKRYHVPTHSLLRYGEYRSFTLAQDSVIFCHRRGHKDHSGLIMRGDK